MTKLIHALPLLVFSLGSLLAQSLTVTSPADGTVVHPGESVTVTVEASGGSFQQVYVIGQDPIPISQPLAAPPYRFTIQIPSRITPDKYMLTADGFTSPGHGASSESIVIVVEHADNPFSIRVEPTILELTPAEMGSLRIIGRFNDGSTADLTQSTLINYISNATGVATVGPYGIVTGVGPGSATVTASYGGLSIGVPVTVPQPITVGPPLKALYASQTAKFGARLSGLSKSSIVWSVTPEGAGSIDGTGFYMAPSIISSQQTVTVTATNEDNPAQFSTATVLLYPPAAVTIQPPTATLSQSQTQRFATAVANAHTQGVSFSISPSGMGSIDNSGIYTAPSSITTQQVVTLEATSWADSTKSATATITLKPLP